MLTIQLNRSIEERLQKLAAAHGQEAAQLAQRVIEEYLDFQEWKKDSEEDWAAASSALAPEIFPEETWAGEDSDHGPR